jgi:hypothetical protein
MNVSLTRHKCFFKTKVENFKPKNWKSKKSIKIEPKGSEWRIKFYAYLSKESDSLIKYILRR